jgi:asparagine synthase (glutamine-hydrolysing)
MDVVDVIPYTVGFPSSTDLSNAEDACGALGLSLKALSLDDGKLVGEARSLLSHFPGLDPVTLSFEIPLWTLLRRCEESVVLAGQGADELFGGYARYMDMEDAALEEAMDEDLSTLLNETLPRERRMGELFRKDLRLPYCHPAVVTAVRSLPLGLKRGPRRKEALRRVARKLGLPPEVVDRPKKAAQYGSGVMGRLKAIAKKEGMAVRDFLSHLEDIR